MSNEKRKVARIQLGYFFKNRREEMGISLEQLSLHIGISANTLDRIENGLFDFGIDVQFKIMEALEIKPYFSTTKNPLEEDYRLRKENDPERYHGFYTCDNILLYPGELAIVKMTYPRLFVRFNYGESYFSSFEDWKNNHTDLQWLDPDDKPNSDEEIDEILTDCWNFLALEEAEEDRLADLREMEGDDEH